MTVAVTHPGVADGAHEMEPHSPRSDGLRRRGFKIPHKASKVLVQTKAALSKHVKRIAKKADEHEHFINKVTYSIGVLCFGTFCYILGRRPYDIPHLYALFFCIAAPLRWAYYKSKKWHYFLLDFCYYANAILISYLLFFPDNAKLFLLCFAFSEGPLAWALVVWRCSLVFSSVDKVVSVLIHLLPGTVLYIIRWWDPHTFSVHLADDTGPFPPWPQVDSTLFLCLWMIAVPLAIYALWQLLYYLVVEVVRRQRFARDPEVLTSFRELSRQAAKQDTFLWRLSGRFGEFHRLHMFLLFQGIFTILTAALTVPMFRSYNLHSAFQVFKVAASIWNGGNFLFDVMPKQVQARAERKRAMKVAPEILEPQEGHGVNKDVGLSPPPKGFPSLPLDVQLASTPSTGSEDSDEDVWEEVWEEVDNMPEGAEVCR